MSLLFQLVFLVLLSCIGLTHGAQKMFTIDGIKKCDAKSAEINACLKSNAYVAWPVLVKGVKDFDSPPLDPFDLKKLEFTHEGAAISGTLEATNLKIIGLSKLVLNSVDVKVSNKKKISLKSKLTVPKLQISGAYSGQVKVLVPFKPKGTFNLVLDNVEVEVSSESETSSKDGHIFAKVTDLKVEPKIGDLNLEADESVVKQFISKPIIKRINKDWRKYYSSVMPQTRKIWLPKIVELINKLGSVTPIEKVIEL